MENPETGRQLDVFDMAAQDGMAAEKAVENLFGAKDGDGSVGDKVGGVAGGATAGVMSAACGLGVGAMDAVDGAAKLFGGMFD
jgi:hypothetical protein